MKDKKLTASSNFLAPPCSKFVELYGATLRVFAGGNMRKKLQLILVSSAPLAAVTVVAQPNLGDWQASSGNISAGCPAGATCEIVVEDAGFIQQRVLDSAGELDKIQTIVLDADASGNSGTLPFSNEMFVEPSDPNAPVQFSGLLNLQIIKEETIDQWKGSVINFESEALVRTGWAEVSGLPNLSFDQLITESGGSRNDSFMNDFDFEGNVNNATGAQTGTQIVLNSEFIQPVGADSNADEDGDIRTARVSGSLEDTSDFRWASVSGDMLSSSGSNSLPNGSSISWNAGDKVVGYWQGQKMTHQLGDRKDFESEFDAAFLQLSQGFNTVENRTTNDSSRYFTFGPVGPFNWPSILGPAPAIADVRTGPTGPEDGPGPIRRERSTTPTEPFQAASTTQPSPSSPSGSPVPFNTWTVASGEITATCPSGSSCGQAISMDGFMQRIVRDNATSREYFQTVVTDLDASGSPGSVPFSSESLVSQQSSSGQAINGVLTQQLINDGMGMTDRTVVRTGWAESSEPNITVDNRISQTLANRNVSAETKFIYAANIDPDGNRTGFTIDSEQVLDNATQIDPNARTFSRDDYIFVSREVAGDFLTSSGSMGGMGWAAGDDIKTVWAGYVFDYGEESAVVSFQNWDNRADSAAPRAISKKDEGGTPRVWVWNSAFGPQPTFPFPGGSGGD